MTGLGDLDGGIFESTASSISADGQTIVGSGHSALAQEAMRWTQSTGWQGLGDLPAVIMKALHWTFLVTDLLLWEEATRIQALSHLCGIKSMASEA